MNKTLWSDVLLDGSIPETEVKDWIRISYNLVFAKLPKKVRMELAARHACLDTAKGMMSYLD